MNILLAAAIMGFFSLMLYGIFELSFLKKTEYTIEGLNIPPSLDGKKIALLSDIHGIEHGKGNIRLFDMLKNINPDIIIISGDLINGRGETEIRFAFRLLKGLKKLRVPVLYTFGNHEEKLKRFHPKSYTRLRRIAKKNVILLNNRQVKIDGLDDVCFVGLNLPLFMSHDHDRYGIIKRRTEKIFKNTEAANCYKILVSHDPEHHDLYAENGYDLALSGHLHGGLIYFPLLGGMVTPRFQFFYKLAKGFHRFGNMNMIVSGGIGWHDIPIRLFNHPEIVTIVFKRKERVEQGL